MCIRDRKTPEAHGRVFNIGSTNEVSIMKLAETVISLTGSKSEIRKVPYESVYPVGFEDMERRLPDTTRIFETIGFRPETPLEEVITDVIAEKRSLTDAA